MRRGRGTATAVARRCVGEAAGLSSALGYRPRARRGKAMAGAGDVHDVGKNLVNIMFEGAGFEVIDLGTSRTSSASPRS
jgi:methylmalonyl-CoA mutase cobalamin-binding subunit